MFLAPPPLQSRQPAWFATCAHTHPRLPRANLAATTPRLPCLDHTLDRWPLRLAAHAQARSTACREWVMSTRDANTFPNARWETRARNRSEHRLGRRAQAWSTIMAAA